MTATKLTRRDSPQRGQPARAVADIDHLQRARLMTAAIAVVERHGICKLTVARIVRSVRMSRKTFYDLYPDAEACLLAAVEQTLARTREMLENAYASQRGWRDGMRAATGALLDAIEQRPGLARVCIVEALAAGPAVRARRAQAIRYLTAMIERGSSAPRAHDAPPHIAHALAGGIGELLGAKLIEMDSASFAGLHGPIMGMIVLPYLGHAAAREELRLCAASRAATPRAQPDAQRDPLAQLNMRLTYRTVRVLLAIADTPRACSREVGGNAGIADQAQTSKLLKRLMGLGLIENVGEGQLKGVRKEWVLTARGAEFARSSRVTGF